MSNINSTVSSVAGNEPIMNDKSFLVCVITTGNVGLSSTVGVTDVVTVLPPRSDAAGVPSGVADGDDVVVVALGDDDGVIVDVEGAVAAAIVPGIDVDVDDVVVAAGDVVDVVDDGDDDANIIDSTVVGAGGVGVGGVVVAVDAVVDDGSADAAILNRLRIRSGP